MVFMTIKSNYNITSTLTSGSVDAEVIFSPYISTIVGGTNNYINSTPTKLVLGDEYKDAINEVASTLLLENLPIIMIVGNNKSLALLHVDDDSKLIREYCRRILGK